MKHLIAFLAYLLVSFGSAGAATYYVSTTGNTTNPCTEALPCSTFSRAVKKMQPGDKLYIRAGTYHQYLAGRAASPGSTEIPSGTGPDNRTVISAYPINRTCTGDNPPDVTPCYASTYEPVTLTQNHGGVGGIIGFRGLRQWVTYEGLILAEGSESGIMNNNEGGFPNNPPACDNKPSPVGPSDIRYLNIETRNNKKDGYHCAPMSARLEFLNINAHHNGTNEMNHGAYCSGTDHLTDHSKFWNNAGLGAQFYRSGTFPCVPVTSGQVVQRSIFFGNTKNGAYLGGLTSNTTFLNNMIYGNGGGLFLGAQSGVSHKAYNNTIVNSRGPALTVQQKDPPALPARPYLQNNIVSGMDLNNSIPVVNSHNFIIAQQGDPGFVDAANGDFRLQPGSPAIDAGTPVDEVDMDYDAIARPQGLAYDIGAHELVPPEQQLAPGQLLATSNNFSPDHLVTHLFDGCVNDLASCKSGNQKIASFWMTMDLGAPYALTRARLFGDAVGTWWSVSWSLQTACFPEGPWTNVFTKIPSLGNQWFEQPLNIAGRYVRVEVFGNPAYPPGRTEARELEIYGRIGVCP